MKPVNPGTSNVIPGPGTVLPSGADRSIGALLIDLGKIQPEDAERILRYAKERSVRFGDAAVALRLVTQEEIQRALAQQFDYPYLTSGESPVSREVVAAWMPFSAQVEALRALRSQLLLRWFTGEQGNKAIGVVGPERGVGRSHLAANLAVVFSQLGERTLLIDADLRNPRQHELFGLRNSVGLSSILAERASADVVQRIPGLVDLSVLPSGPIPPNPLELLGRANFAELMSVLGTSFDVIIADTPASELGSDHQLVAQKTRGVVVVARRNRSSTGSCLALAGEVAASGAVVVGGVMNER